MKQGAVMVKILIAVGILAVVVSFMIPLLFGMDAARGDFGVGIIGGADTPTYWMCYRYTGMGYLMLAGVVLIVVALIWKKKKKR